jgi:hypothetical protein
MSIFEELSRKLIAVYYENESDDIEGNIFNWFETSNGKFGFKYMRNYSGKVAFESRRSNVNRQQGLFDIQVVTGHKVWKENQSEGYKVTHRDCFKSIIDSCTIEQVIRVWKGENPLEVGNNENQQESLATMALLMFEQEINYGDGNRHPWQYNRQSKFKPYTRKGMEEKRRPRDMIMGFICQGFSYGIEGIKYQMTGKRSGTYWFGNPFDGGGWSKYPDEYKLFFLELQEMNGGAPVIHGETLVGLQNIADNEVDNPLHVPG